MRFDTDLRNIDLLEEPGDFLAFTILNSGNVFIYHRKYFKLQDYLTTIGGIIKSISIFCSLLNYFNAKNAYYTKIITDFIIHNQIKRGNSYIGNDDNSKNNFNLSNNKSTNKVSSFKIIFYTKIDFNQKTIFKSSLKFTGNKNFLNNANKNIENFSDVRSSNSYSIFKQKNKLKKDLYHIFFLLIFL